MVPPSPSVCAPFDVSDLTCDQLTDVKLYCLITSGDVTTYKTSQLIEELTGPVWSLTCHSTLNNEGKDCYSTILSNSEILRDFLKIYLLIYKFDQVQQWVGLRLEQNTLSFRCKTNLPDPNKNNLTKNLVQPKSYFNFVCAYLTKDLFFCTFE